ncbi:transmembrane protein 59-like isoform X1 [Haliotis rufescens]|uniref:transmembrane protein 59-like isoform X1 n=1 Tax=Haliotis rufescens TaxID=6454 RepID=UPI001EB079AF|nr:transmembrane protein 59-like isoform X1 [Haliotis rufescens]
MAASTTNRVIVAVWALLVTLSAASDVFDHVLTDVKPCMEVCENTYPSHTYEKQGNHHECCRRGCRFYSIMEFVNGGEEVNTTQKECMGCCKESYPAEADYNACALGCRSQTPFAARRHQLESEEPSIHLLYPLMYVHSLYSNMIEKAYHSMTVSWSLYMEADNGKLVVIKSQPQFYTEFNDAQDLDDYKGMNSDDKTANYLEMNIEPIDNAATPNLKHSQLRSARSFEDSLGLMSDDRNVNSDWLTCIARKTGIPRLLLCLLILFCAIVMIWLCLTAAVTAPEHRIHTQKLSINGDLEYLREMVKQGKGIQVLHPQDRVEASPLPIKIRVERI